MSDPKQYEQTIAGKLEALPLPDLADAIWARIEARLDVELPPDKGPGGDAPHLPTGGFIIGGFGLILLTALYLFFKPTEKAQPNKLPQPSTHTTTLPTLSKPQESPPAPFQTTGPAANNATGTATIPPALRDSAFAAAPSSVLLQDSVVPMPVLPPVAAATPQQKDTLPPAKKGRGVTGITDNDYRIVPKKDSTEP